MRVPADHLACDGIDHVGEAEQRLLRRHLRVVDDLEQEIAELILEPADVLARDRVGDLVSFLDGVGGDRCEALLHVPRATRNRIAQARHDGEQIVERVLLVAAISHGAAPSIGRQNNALPRDIHQRNQWYSGAEPFSAPHPRFA